MKVTTNMYDYDVDEKSEYYKKLNEAYRKDIEDTIVQLRKLKETHIARGPVRKTYDPEDAVYVKDAFMAVYDPFLAMLKFKTAFRRKPELKDKYYVQYLNAHIRYLKTVRPKLPLGTKI